MLFSPYDYDVHEDPYPIYRRLRDEFPLYRNHEVGFWALSRYADVLDAFKRPDVFSNAKGVSLERSSQADASAVCSFLALDPPRHDQIRAIVSKAFTPRRVAELEPSIRALARGYIENVRAAGRCDFIADFAAKLPMDVISEMLGVPAADRDTLRLLADTVVHREEGVSEIPAAGIEASGKLLVYFSELVKERSLRRGEDLPSALLDAEIEGERLGPREVMAFLFLMIIAGNETTTKLLGNAVYWRWRNPAEAAKVEADPAMIPAWIEETLRYDNSTQMLARTVLSNTDYLGERLHEGDKVLLLIGSANRDESVFARADEYDISRDTAQHISFGKGTHFCLGASLARLEARVALEEVEALLGPLDLDESGFVRVHSPNVRGFSAMPVRFPSSPR